LVREREDALHAEDVVAALGQQRLHPLLELGALERALERKGRRFERRIVAVLVLVERQRATLRAEGADAEDVLERDLGVARAQDRRRGVQLAHAALELCELAAADE